MRVLLQAFLITVCIPGAAHATYGAFDMGALTGTLSQDHVTKSEEARARAGGQSPGLPISSLSQSIARQTRGLPAPDAVSASYRPSQAVRARLAEIMAEGAEQRQPGTAAEMRELVLSKKALDEFQRVAGQMGLRTNDAADALAFYMLAQWGVANDYRAEITPVQVAAVRQQARSAFATIADQLDTDALRQEFAEMLAIQGTIMAGVHEAAVRAGDSVVLQRYADLAREGGRQLFTIDPTRIALTDQGFRRKSDLGALSSEGRAIEAGVAPARLAIAQEKRSDDDSIPVGAALALFAGAAGILTVARAARKG